MSTWHLLFKFKQMQKIKMGHLSTKKFKIFHKKLALNIYLHMCYYNDGFAFQLIEYLY